MCCTKCGSLNDDTARFCTSCGNDMAAEVTAQPENACTQASYANSVSNAPKTLSNNSALDTLKTHGRSILFLIATILYSVMAFFQFLEILSSFSVGSDIGKSLNEISPTASPEIALFSAVFTLSGLFRLIGMTPTVLILIGLWMFRAASGFRSASRVTRYSVRRTAGIFRICLRKAFISLLFQRLSSGAASSPVSKAQVSRSHSSKP